MITLSLSQLDTSKYAYETQGQNSHNELRFFDLWTEISMSGKAGSGPPLSRSGGLVAKNELANCGHGWTLR